MEKAINIKMFEIHTDFGLIAFHTTVNIDGHVVIRASCSEHKIACESENPRIAGGGCYSSMACATKNSLTFESMDGFYDAIDECAEEFAQFAVPILEEEVDKRDAEHEVH